MKSQNLKYFYEILIIDLALIRGGTHTALIRDNLFIFSLISTNKSILSC